MRSRGRCLACLIAATFSTGHVGSPTVHFAGPAGPYRVRVTIRPPDVLPGMAQVVVRAPERDVERVRVRPFRWDTGEAGAPAAEEASPVSGAPGTFAADFWVMTSGSHGVRVTLSGALGDGWSVIPVTMTATGTKPLRPWLATMLVLLGGILLAGAVVITGAAVREGALPPGAAPDAAGRRRARIAMTATAGVLLAAAVAAAAWWRDLDAAGRGRLFRPLHVSADVIPATDGRRLRIVIDDRRWRGGGWTPIVPNHGKLIHLFLIRAPGQDVLAHLHPVTATGDTFAFDLPPLPAGPYRLYADVVHESGFTQTLVDTLTVERGETAAPGDPDDSYHWDRGSATGSSMRDTLSDGSIMTLEVQGGALVGDHEVELRISVRPPDGGAARLEPYLGMAAHAVLERDDGTVFVHLHPTGTIPAGASHRIAAAAPVTSAHSTAAVSADPTDTTAVVMPYAFPRPGRYRLWVQIKRAGRVLTGVFDVRVSPLE